MKNFWVDWGGLSFLYIFNQPCESVLETFLSLCWAGSDSPLSVSQLLYSQLLQNLPLFKPTSSGCRACTKSCLLAKMSTGTVASSFSWMQYHVQRGVFRVLHLLLWLALCLRSQWRRRGHRCWWSSCPNTRGVLSVLRYPRRWVWTYRGWGSWCWSPEWGW